MAFQTDLTPTKSASVGDAVTLAVVAKDGAPPYSYKWLWKGSSGDFVEIDGTSNPTALTANLVIHAVTTTSAGSYKCEVTDSASTKITSVESVLTVA